MGEFFLSILGFNAAGILIYTRHVSGSQFHAGEPVSISYPNPNRKPLVGFYRIYGGIYSFDTINALMTSRETNIIDRDMYAMPMQKHLRDEEIYTAVSKGYAVRALAKKYNWHHGAISLAAERYAAWLGAGNTPITTRVESPKPQTFRPEAQLPAQDLERQSKIYSVLAAWGDDDVVYETKPTPVQPSNDNTTEEGVNETLAYIDELIASGIQSESLATYNDPQTEELWINQAKFELEYFLQSQGFSEEDIALWSVHRLTR